MPDLDANVHPNGLAGAGSGGGVEPVDREGSLALARASIGGAAVRARDAGAAGDARTPRLKPTASEASSHAASPFSETPARRHPVVVALTYLDLVCLALATPLALALGAPVLGYSIGAGAWLLQRGLAVLARALVRRVAEPGNRLGLNFVDAFARIWLLVGAIVAAGVSGRRADGLAAALVIAISYSIAFAVRVASGRPGADER
jgi:hypothetical protein